MALKRKRSSPAFSSPTSDVSDATTLSSPLPFFYVHSKPVDALVPKPTWSFYTCEDEAAGQHLNSRTRKRHRDDRPDEQQVYANTIKRLFEAQKQHPNASPVHSQPIAQPQQPTQPQKSTLHSYWRIGQASTTAPMAIDMDYLPPATRFDLRCEDCERSLRPTDVMDIDVDILEQEASCQFCRLRVCDCCAVLGDIRVCLACASKGRQNPRY